MLDPFSHFLVLSVIETKLATAIMAAFVKDILLKGYLPTQIIISDNGSEFKNELFAAFIRQLRQTYGLDGSDHGDYLKHVFIAVYSPQQNPVERVNRFIKAMLQTLVNEKGRSFSEWENFVAFVEYAYNKIRIPGTKVSPFMLRHGRVPLEPQDWSKVIYEPTMNITMAEHLDRLMTEFKIMEESVKKAHSYAKAEQRIRYNQHQLNVEYEVGEQVLAWFPGVVNKLIYRWRGPFVILKKINPAVYWIRDLKDDFAEPRKESIRNLVRIPQQPHVDVQSFDPTKRRIKIKFNWSPSLQKLKKGKFVLFRMPTKFGNDWRKRIYCGEVYEEFDDYTEYVSIHFYDDFGDKDDPSTRDSTKSLTTRRFLPVFTTDKGVKFTDPKKRHTTSIPDVADFRAQEIDILVGNYDMHGKKVPKNVAAKSYEIIDQRDREHGPPQPSRR